MSNFFQKAIDDLDSLEEEILGPDYPYYKYIKSPSEMGMSSSGGDIATDIGGLIAYTEVLVTGRGNASATGKPLGDKFFLKTGATCKDKASGESVTRSLYVNNVPDGNIPFISSMTGASFTDFEGLVPGTLSDMNNLNPLGIFQAFMLGTNPECQALTMPTIDANNVNGTETAYVVTSDISNMNPCWFSNGKNPITGANCKEAFSTIIPSSKMPSDPLLKFYIASLGLLGLFIIIKALERKH